MTLNLDEITARISEAPSIILIPGPNDDILKQRNKLSFVDGGIVSQQTLYVAPKVPLNTPEELHEFEQRLNESMPPTLYVQSRPETVTCQICIPHSYSEIKTGKTHIGHLIYDEKLGEVIVSKEATLNDRGQAAYPNLPNAPKRESTKDITSRIIVHPFPGESYIDQVLEGHKQFFKVARAHSTYRRPVDLSALALKIQFGEQSTAYNAISA